MAPKSDSFGSLGLEMLGVDKKERAQERRRERSRRKAPFHRQTGNDKLP